MQFALALAFAGIFMTAQPTSAPAFVETLVDAACIGGCANKTEMTYMAPEVGTDVEMLLKVEDYDLCPSHAAGAAVYVDGKFYTKILLEGKAVYPITVAAGSEVKIIAAVKTVNPTIRCIELGDVRIALYEAI